MPEAVSGGAVAGGMKLAALLLEEAEKQGVIDRLKTWFKKKPRVLLLGPTGTGKTNFLHSLSVERPDSIPRSNRTQFPDARVLMIKGKEKQPYRFVDTPGDTSPGMKDARTDAIREAMSAKGGIAGVINVVSYGYHEYHISKQKALTADGKVDPGFLAKHRQIEIDQLDDWTPLLGSPLTTKWLITVVTKADLWWEQREQVKEHYVSGPYFAALRSAKSLHPKVVEYSSVFSRFYGEAPHSAYFDENDRFELKKAFIDTLLLAIVQHNL